MNALTAIQSYLSNFSQSTNSNAVSIARQLLPISEDAQVFLALLEQEIDSQVSVLTESRYCADIRDSAYASYVDLNRMYSDIQEYIQFWQTQNACQIPAYAERYSGISQHIGAFFAAMADFIMFPLYHNGEYQEVLEYRTEHADLVTCYRGMTPVLYRIESDKLRDGHTVRYERGSAMEVIASLES